MTGRCNCIRSLHGVDHTARPTWKLRETVHFYRDILGLPLVHCISAKGWGREKENHADFLHFFFDSGNDSTIAFFYYIGTTQPPELVVPKGYMAMANHTAWRVDSEAELLEWQQRLEGNGVNVSQFVQHEVIEFDLLPRSQLVSARDHPQPARSSRSPMRWTQPRRSLRPWNSRRAAAGSTIEQLWRHKVKFVQASQGSRQ